MLTFMSFRSRTISPLRCTKISMGRSEFRKCCKRSRWRLQRTGEILALTVFCMLLFKLSHQLRSRRESSSGQTYRFFTSALLPKRYPDYGVKPVSSLRPINQFSFGNTFCRNNEHFSQPVLTILTVTKNPRRIMTETANFIRAQSLCAIRWVIVSDYTTDRNSFKLLENFASEDVRVTVLNNSFTPGFSNGRNFALEHLKRSPTPFFAFLDDDDMFELTSYEKLIWLLESNHNLYMAGSFIVGFGEKNYTWKQGFHDGRHVFSDRNPLSGSEVLRTSVLYETPCYFDPMLSSGMEDWDFFLCLAAHGKWGSTVPDYLFWYRQNPLSMRKRRWNSLFEDKGETVAYIRSKYGNLNSSFPEPFTKERIPHQINMTIPFTNKLRVMHGVMVVLSSEDILDCHTNPILMIRNMCRDRQRVTVVNTAMKMKDTPGALHRCTLLSTHDIFDLPAMLRIADVPRFLSYLIKSRNIDRVFVSQSGYARGLVPWLASFHRDIEFFALTESITGQASDRSKAISRVLRDISPCMPRSMKLSEAIFGDDSIIRPEERARSMLVWFWGSHFCEMKIFRTTQQILREFAKTNSDDRVVYKYDMVHEFLLHSIWPKI